MTETRPSRTALGSLGEDVAETFLVRAGMTVLDRNWRCREGEIDLVLRDADEIVVCEVKTRTSTAFGHPVEAITRAKLARLRRLAGCWTAAHAPIAGSLRLDVVGLLARPDGSFAVDHRIGVGQ